MCTVIVGFDPDADTPLVIAAIRDEMRVRPWDGPGRHWPDRPGLIGGRDRLAGGTWLAVDPRRARVAALLNGWPWDGRMPWEGTYPASRGELPLRALDHPVRDPLHGEDPTLYAPFHLLDADAHHATLYSWDGRCMDTRHIPTGVSVIVNTGLDPADPRATRHTPAFANARPDPDPTGARTPEEIWGDWLRLITEAAHARPRSAGLDDAGDPGGLIAHADLGEGRIWATGSITLLAVGRDTVRYAFTATPADPDTWTMVDTDVR
ncbi:NRDE family protein [Nocardiopsis lambiniae]|uniref:NRDE family protein n=1 Tax=Nocardiopsis lambiniae TaxID=3075539 RepID=A0ABU2MH61_9ACTN|nr:NRDE family protein [Nocardiopsis sp. DSM 44743]MDT0332054.1 NRDE family protein [Nocardiopsis sp. DSM 44743]